VSQADVATDGPRRRRTRAEQQAETRRRLLDAAGVVFRERGLHGASIEAITEQAGFTRGAFYSNFASKEELFIELMHDRVYSSFQRLFERPPDQSLTSVGRLRDNARKVAARYEGSEGRWLFELWLELLAHAARDADFAGLAATFWTGNRRLIAELAEREAAAAGIDLPLSSDRLATAQIALDIGLAVQHLVDPDAVPLEIYPELYEAVFGRFVSRDS
jgi:AcrR family transcriptional regulator